MKISVIIPVMNEVENLKALLPLFQNGNQNSSLEVIIVDGGSNDGTKQEVLAAGFTFIESDIQSRAVQMNLGAKIAKGDILYFVHADVRILKTFFDDIKSCLDDGFQAGCFAYNFDSTNKMLQINSWFTEFNGVLSGGGDQTLFIKRNTFWELGGFDDKYCLMEDFDLVRRIKKKYSFKVIPNRILVSARKYEKNSWLRVQLANLTLIVFFHLKVSPIKLKKTYSKLLK
ncbi:TIGR04283 family arsenosugar biosynthesis glycosyltransferase [Aquiflexum sp. TKW24L]|uniref:TIGR04283 family arsenosugar biosynthesis glycosyltransferase n=1 Tax=Aquiflexum sp. TKW24L TaxID=2942212 RepID=UPI0020C04E4B|nr:TIGR04283 family arsenosugar biosynthesis glycosyltransferase [Aquiflexum sp. TKW24L]MCL6258170.1 TIGR04283 family arsenosugar biosynthesis glycosyltransferase [Aquiflexum sp. TKW24L]